MSRLLFATGVHRCDPDAAHGTDDIFGRAGSSALLAPNGQGGYAASAQLVIAT
jgi:hypothetical protein